jgi:hypothetical protein
MEIKLKISISLKTAIGIILAGSFMLHSQKLDKTPGVIDGVHFFFLYTP